MRKVSNPVPTTRYEMVVLRPNGVEMRREPVSILDARWMAGDAWNKVTIENGFAPDVRIIRYRGDADGEDITTLVI